MNPERCATTGPPARRATPRTRLALSALAALTIGLGGCQSLQSINPFRNCHGCGPLSRIGVGNGNGLFNRNRGQVIYDEPPIIVDQAPGVEVLPGAPIISDPGVPVGSPIVPADPGLTPLPQVSPPDDALELEPLPEPSGRAPQDSVKTSANPYGARPIGRAPQGAPGVESSTGDPYADRMARRSSDEAPYRPSPSPASGPGGAGPRPALAQSVSVIDRLPRAEGLDPASDPAPSPIGPIEAAVPPPPAVPAPEASPAASADHAPAPEPVAQSAPAPGEGPAPPPPEAGAFAPPTAATTIPEPQPDSGAASGIGSFHSVEPLLAGGSFPSADAGWAELAGLGYRTVLDLRPIGQVRQEDFAASSRAGLRHLLLPTTPGVIDAGLVRRFNEELAQEPARPLFFCDLDGSTAAALWYVHLVAEDRYDPSRARRDAERIAPIPAPLFLAAQGFLDGRNAAAPPDQAVSSAPIGAPGPVAETGAVVAETSHTTPVEPEPQAGPAPAPEPPLAEVEPSAVASAPEAPPTPGTPTEPEPEPAPAEVSVAEVFDDPFARPAPADPKAWGPYAALFLTILAVPLAYWSGLGIPGGLRGRIRASLAAPARRPQSLPGGSDAGT
ncbi:hypothetical protein [Tautonia plasticadhaerens]|uniref:Beta-lactamase hydrolase-like protein n=1 Tax=Tautonia plasticadhaerens TaxID=2527974 RepID=A0A518HAU0_9BACT|nr:hypothetical protein [Tautonia plasticadhaerens]QDV37927.1 hypothetical protein ElP_58740 [Tautonia plasticadhaerens]